MWVCFAAWIAVLFLNPSEFGSQLIRKLEQSTSGTVFGITGSIFLIFSGPVVIIAFLSMAHLIIWGEEELRRKKTSKRPRFRLWTFPVLVDGPFGRFCSSPPDRYPATRYHVRMGHLTMLLFTLHGLFYVIAWTVQGHLLQLWEWQNIGLVNLPAFSWSDEVGYITSSSEKALFELFFYTDQLYIVYVVFLALHVGDFICSIAAGGIFLFVLDWFLTFCQSRTVDVLSSSCLPCGTVELVLSKTAMISNTMLSVSSPFKIEKYLGCSPQRMWLVGK